MTDEAMPQTDERAVGGWKSDAFATRAPRSEGIEQMKKVRAKSIAGHCSMWACIGLVTLWRVTLAADFEPPPDKTGFEEEPVDTRQADATAGERLLGAADDAGKSDDASDAAAESAPAGSDNSTDIGDGDPGSGARPGEPAPATTAPDSTERIEEALDEAATPLDAVAFSIEHGEFEGAEQFLEHYINALESAHHRYHPDLVRPLTLLGDTQLARQQLDRALAAFSRALHIRRVNNGLFTPDQVAVVYKQAGALQAMGNLEEANSREEYAYEVLLKAHGPLSEEVLPGTYRLANWYRETYNIFAARSLYERAMRIHEANSKNGTLSALPALKGLVFTYRQERFPLYYAGDNQSSALAAAPLQMSTRATVYSGQITINNFPAAERALQRIVRIRQQDPNSTPLQVFEAILELADWHLMWEHFKRAHTLYEFVFTQMDTLDSVDAAAYFAEPILLHMPLPADPKTPRGSASDAGRELARLQGFIEASFRVSPNGSAQDIEIVAADPEGLMDFRSRRSLRSSRYRPAMTNGKAVPFENQTWRHEFEYVPRNAPEVDDA